MFLKRKLVFEMNALCMLYELEAEVIKLNLSKIIL